MNTFFKIIFFAVASFIMMFFLGGFREENALLHRLIIMFLSVCYCFAPLVLSKIESTKHLIENKRNALWLSLAGFFFVFVVSISIPYGFLSVRFLSAFFVGFFVIGMMLYMLRPVIAAEAE